MVFECTLKGIKIEGKLILWERVPTMIKTLQNIMQMRETDLAAIIDLASQSNGKLST